MHLIQDTHVKVCVYGGLEAHWCYMCNVYLEYTDNTNQHMTH